MLTVADIMTREVVTVTPGASLRDAAMAMLRHGVSGLPVVDADGALVGIVSEADFVAQEAVHDLAVRPRLLGPLFGREGAALASAETVGDVMTADVVTVVPDARISAAARRMAAGVKRLPVVDAAGTLVGIVSRADIMAVFARADEAIAAEIGDLLARGLLPIDLERVQVDVADGVVTLRGTVDARVDAAIFADIVGRFHGVVRVDDRLEWDVDDRIPEQRYPGYPQAGRES